MFRLPIVPILLATALTALTALAGSEEMFPPTPAAKPYIDFDGHGFLVNGHRYFLASGSIHYARVPRELWHDRLLRLKRAGFDNVQTYIFWNYHEPRENDYEFSGSHDMEAYLREAQNLGLTATVRVGPYSCAEWDSGGYPIWLRFKPGLIPRRDDPPYLTAQDHWLDVIIPKVAAHQINRGGNVILIQLENEGAFWGAWPRPTNNHYFDDLYNEGIKNGIQVPFFMSGYHHGSVPIPENPDNTGRQCPWISTEIWCGWYSNYGSSDYQYMRTLRCNDKILARGGNGLNYYMFQGGSNFDTWNDNENSASYDYGTTVGETGDLRPIYYALKANNIFSTSFADILEYSSDATSQYQDFAKNARVIGARKSPAGTIVFVQGLVANTDPAIVKPAGGGKGGAIHIPALEVCPVVLDAPLIPGVKIVEGVTNILGVARNGATATLIVYGDPADTGHLALDVDGEIRNLHLAYPTAMPAQQFVRSGSQTLRILSMSRQLSDRTWIVGVPQNQPIVVGPEYVGDFSDENGKPSMTIERPYTHAAPNQVVVYGRAATPPQHLAVVSDSSIDSATAPTLASWQMSLPAESSPAFDDSTWLASTNPQQMGADGDISAFAWYRATVEAPAAGSGTLRFAGAADHIIVFVNGKRVPATPSIVNPRVSGDDLRHGNLSWAVQADILAGANCIAVLATHQGRAKGPTGLMSDYFPKGIFKPVTLSLAGQNIPVTNWKMRGGLPDQSTIAFGPLAPCDAPAFFHTTFTAKPPTLGANPMLRFDTSSLSRGTLYMNGHCLGRYPSTLTYNHKQLGMYLPECWFAPNGQNSLVLFDEEGRSPADAKIAIEVPASREVIAVSNPIDPSTTFQLPPYNPVDLRPGAQLNAATDKPATASSSAPDHDVSVVDDADDQSVWEPATPPSNAHPAWVQIDLQKPRSLLSFEIFWNSTGYPYCVEGSLDGKSWKTLVPTTQIPERLTSFDKLSTPANVRYIRLTVSAGPGSNHPFGVRDLRAWDVPHNG